MMNRLGRLISVGGTWAATLVTLGLTGSACLSRPVGKEPPTTKVNFTSTVSQQAVDKVDILFAIDNSSSMGDKQGILADAVPNLIQGLLRPRCVNADGTPIEPPIFADPTGNKANRYGCAQGEPEFKPVIDMHIGIVSSSLGNFGGDVCPVANNPRANDRGYLLDNQKTNNGTPGKVAEAQPSKFLAWFPQAEENTNSVRHPPPANPIRTIETFTTAFQELVRGVDQTGCGLEAQLESVYRFLNQPDPWDSIKLAGRFADLGDAVDETVLKQRKEFLRPDSLVAVIMLTDEDDSSSDPLSLGGQGWAFMARSFPGSDVERDTGGHTAPRGTQICETDPKSPDCRSCGFQTGCDGQEWCARLRADPNCRESGIAGQSGNGFDGYYPPDDDELNVRFHRMKQRFGIDPQYPLSRYIDGFTKFRVPDRSTEHVIVMNGEQRQISDYSGTPKCTNPLFATDLPDSASVGPDGLCNLKRGTRSPDLVFFAVVGGVPTNLLYPDGYKPGDPEANRTTQDRWNTIIGRDPINYDYTGIDPHMIQSVTPRPGLGGADRPRGDNGNDVHGREWDTRKGDLQYACTFDLPRTPVDLTRKCVAGDQSCDCAPDTQTNPPLCGSGAESDRQIRAKAYPTIRQFTVARALGDQGIAASLCPIQLDPNRRGEETYGYNPAVAAIVDRLKNALTTQCLPQKLYPNEENLTPCLVLAQLPEGEDCGKYNLNKPKQEILDVFLEQQRAESGNLAAAGAIDLSRLAVCQLEQVRVERGQTCRDASERTWCYVENGNGQSPAGRCPQALIFSAGTADMAGARFSLQCIQNLREGQAAGDTAR